MDERYPLEKLAAAEQETAAYRDLTAELMRLHIQALAVMGEDLVVESDQLTVRSRLLSIRVRMAEMLGEALLQDQEPDSVFSYVMYLIHVVTMAREQETKMGALLNELTTTSNEMARLLGMVPLVGGGSHDLGEDEVVDFVTGSGQKLTGVHPKEQCEGWCVVHNPLSGPWDPWPTVWRGDGPFDVWRGFERVCVHGMGHPAIEEILRDNRHTHGCCGICPCGPPKAVPVFNDAGELVKYQ